MPHRVFRHRPMVATLALALALAAAPVAMAQDRAPAGGHAHGAGPAQRHAHPAAPQPSAIPTMPGQDAFGAIQEIVRILEADPATDWSKINLAALRAHLIDMNEVMLRAEATERQVDGGLEVVVTGSDRTRDAIHRMLLPHARELNRLPGFRALAETLPDGVRLIVTSSEPKHVAHIRGLGFAGLLVSGAHHQAHHLAMAKGMHFH